MQEQLPSNSQMPKKVVPDQKDEGPKVEKIVTGTVGVRKKPLGRRFVETFFGDSAKGVGMYVLMEVVIPTLKDLIVDAGQQAIERAVRGESSGFRRRASANRPSGPGGYFSYNRVSVQGGSPSQYRRDEPRNISRRGRETHDFQEIEFNDKVDAEDVLRSMYDILERYEMVTVKDFYGLVGITPDFTNERWGWTQLQGSRVVRDGGKYIIVLPPTEQLT